MSDPNRSGVGERFTVAELTADPELDRIYATILTEIAWRCGQVPDVHPRLLEGVVAAARRLRAHDKAATS